MNNSGKVPSEKLSLNEHKLDSQEDDFSELDFAEGTCLTNNAFNLTEFFNDEFGVATKNRTISGNATQSNPYGFISDHLSHHASYSSNPAN